MTTLKTETIPAQFKARNARRHEVLDDYKHHDGRITSPGKFEGEPVFAPYYWGIGLAGFADKDNGATYTFKFANGCADFDLWPELKTWLGRSRTLRLTEDGVGFVRCHR